MSDTEFQAYLVNKIDKIYSDISNVKKIMEIESRSNFEEHTEFKRSFESLIDYDTDRVKMCERNRKDMQRHIDAIRFLPLFWDWFKKDWKYVSIAIVLLNINNVWPILKDIIEMFSY